MKVYEQFAQTLAAMRNCEAWAHTQRKDNNVSHYSAIARQHKETIHKLCRDCLPSGSGFDNGTQFDAETSKPNRLVFHTAFHHMDDNGFYCGWTEHSVIVTPDLGMRFNVRVTGRDKRDIKDLIAESFNYALNSDLEN